MKKTNFKTFLEGSTGAHGEYLNDVAEKTMVHEIIRLLFNNRKEESVYDEVYSFIEWDGAKDFYDRYYPAFEEKSESNKAKKMKQEIKPMSSKASILLGDFRKKVGPLFKQWKATVK